MFSVRQKRDIANKIQQVLRDTGHPELPEGEIQFSIYVAGNSNSSWGRIQNNGTVPNPSVNSWNEYQGRKSVTSGGMDYDTYGLYARPSITLRPIGDE